MDIPGVYLNADMDKYVLMVLRGRLVELMVITALMTYHKYIAVDGKGKPVLYLWLQKALYGCIRSDLLFYKRLTESLQKYGFKINRFDSCVTNKMVNGKQLTMV
eukprot:15360916-Ditylum_brightwellii.AAC.1